MSIRTLPSGCWALAHTRLDYTAYGRTGGGGEVPDPCGAHPQPPLPAAGIFSRRPKKPARGGAAEKEVGAEEPCTFLICDDNDINCQVRAAGVGGEGGGAWFELLVSPSLGTPFRIRTILHPLSEKLRAGGCVCVDGSPSRFHTHPIEHCKD